MTLMTPSHPRWQEFLARLAGPEGCFFRRVDGKVVWDCQHGSDKRKAQALLYQLEAVSVPDSLTWFESQGATCDCAILFTLSPQAHALARERRQAEREAKTVTYRDALRLERAARKRRQARLKRLQAPDPLRHKRLHDIRMQLGVTQQQFALLLEEKSPSAFRTISLMEHRLKPVPDRLMERAEALLTRYKQDPTVIDAARQAAPKPPHAGRPRNPEGVPVWTSAGGIHED